MFTILDQEYHETCLSLRAPRPSNLRAPEVEGLLVALQEDWYALDGAYTETATYLKSEEFKNTNVSGIAPSADLLAWCCPSAARQLMLLADGSWLEWMRNALDHDADILWPGRRKANPKGLWGLFGLGRRNDDGDDGLDQSAPQFGNETSRELHCRLLHNENPPNADPKNPIQEIADLKKRLADLKEIAKKTGSSPKPSTNLLAELNRGGARALFNAEHEWPAKLKELIEEERRNLERIETSIKETDAPVPENGFTGKPWAIPTTAFAVDGLSEESARRQAVTVQDRVGVSASLGLWHAELAEALEPWLCRLPNARLVALDVVPAASITELLQVGMAGPRLRLHITVPAAIQTALMVKADFQPTIDGSTSDRMLADWRRQSKLPGLGAAVRLARAWAEIAPLRSWEDVWASLDSPTPEALRELMGHAALIRNLDSFGAKRLATALPSILRKAPWTGRMDLARTVFLALPEPGRQALGQAALVAAFENRPQGEPGLDELSHAIALAALAQIQSPELLVAEVALRLAFKFGASESLAERVLALLGIGKPWDSTKLHDRLVESFVRLCQQCMGQCVHHGMSSRKALETQITHLLERCAPGMRRRLLASLAEHFANPAPGDLPHRWNPPGDLAGAQDWLEALPAMARLAEGLGSTQWKLADLAEIRGWLADADGTVDSPPKLAPGCFYSAHKLWLLGNGIPAEAMQDLASHATQHRFQEWLCHSDPDFGLALASNHRRWVRDRTSLVPWAGLARDWIFVCGTHADTNKNRALALWRQGVQIFACWGRLSSTSKWLSELGEAAPWKRSSWREIVPVFIEDNSGGFPPQVMDLLVEELFADDDSSAREAWLRRMDALTKGCPDLMRVPGVAAEIDAGVARAAASPTTARVSAAETALWSMASRMLPEKFDDYDAWRRLLPKEPIQVRFALLSALLCRTVHCGSLHGQEKDPFSLRLDVFWEALASQVFAVGDAANGLAKLVELGEKSSSLPREELHRRAIVHLLNEAEVKPDRDIYVHCLRLLELAGSAELLAERSQLISRLIHWVWQQGDRRRASLTNLASAMQRPLPEEALLALGQGLASKGSVRTSEGDDLAELRQSVRDTWAQLGRWPAGELRESLSRTLLVTPTPLLQETWRRQVGVAYAACAAIPKLAAQLHGLLNLI